MDCHSDPRTLAARYGIPDPQSRQTGQGVNDEANVDHGGFQTRGFTDCWDHVPSESRKKTLLHRPWHAPQAQTRPTETRSSALRIAQVKGSVSSPLSAWIKQSRALAPAQGPAKLPPSPPTARLHGAIDSGRSSLQNRIHRVSAQAAKGTSAELCDCRPRWLRPRLWPSRATTESLRITGPVAEGRRETRTRQRETKPPTLEAGL